MTIDKWEAKITELAVMMQEWGMTRRETLLEILYEFYETAGFERERLDAELEPMSDYELLQAYLRM